MIFTLFIWFIASVTLLSVGIPLACLEPSAVNAGNINAKPSHLKTRQIVSIIGATMCVTGVVALSIIVIIIFNTAW